MGKSTERDSLDFVRSLNPSKKFISFFVCACSLIYLCSSGFTAQDSGNILDEFVARTWTAASGLPQNTVHSLIQTRDGYLWMGTPSGLVRFDGIRFDVFTRWNTPALKNDRILSLYEDATGVLWVGTDGGGLCSCRKGAWRDYTREEGLSNAHVRAITGDWRGNVWIGTEYGLNRLNSDGIQVYTTEDGLYDNIITALALDPFGVLWMGTLRGGFAKLENDVIRVYGYKDGLLNMMVHSLAVDGVGNVWIGTQEGLYGLKRGEEVVRYVSGTAYTPIASIVEDQNGSLWIGTMSDGLKRKREGSLAGYTEEDGLSDDYVRCLLGDRDGSVWAGTEAGGLLQLKERWVENVGTDDGLPENAVTAVMEEEKGAFWVGTRSSGLCLLRGGRVARTFNRRWGLSSDRIRIVFKDDAGRLWIGTEDGGVDRLENGSVAHMTMKDGLSSNCVTAILQDGSGALWIGTDAGLNCYRDGNMVSHDGRNGLTDAMIRVLLESREGSLYVGTRGGLFKRSSDGFLPLFSDGQYSEIDVLSLYEDGEGALWIGTNGNGLLRWASGDLHACTTGNGLCDNHIFSITEDDSGHLWMSSYNGVFCVGRKELKAFFEKTASSILPRLFDEADGMSSRQGSVGGQPSCWKAASGKLVFPTTMGVAVFDPKSIPVKTVPPDVVVEDVLADGVSVFEEEKVVISASIDRVVIRFTAFDFAAPEKIRFRYRLEGVDSDFVEVHPRQDRRAEYLNLKPGRHRFVVHAANNDGVWNREGAAVAFEVLSPFYRTLAFYMVCAAAVLSLGGIVVYARHRKTARKRLLKYKTSGLDPARAEATVPKLIQLMEEEKVFLSPDLTLQELAHQLHIHYNHLSRIINERFGLSYNDFVNKYRIEEAKKRLTDPSRKERTVLEIMYDTGFSSKSVFNTAFKKFTGLTPSEFRNRNSSP